MEAEISRNLSLKKAQATLKFILICVMIQRYIWTDIFYGPFYLIQYFQSALSHE